MIWNLFVCFALLMLKYLSILGFIWPFLKLQGRATKIVGDLCCFFITYGIISYLQVFYVVYSLNSRNSIPVKYQFLSGRPVEVFAVSWLVILYEAKTGAADLPIPASQIRGCIHPDPASCSKGQICLPCRADCIWEQRCRKLVQKLIHPLWWRKKR